MPKFRKKPVVIQAIQATGTPESNSEIIDLTRGSEELEVVHASDCATHNEPAMPNGPCDCGVE